MSIVAPQQTWSHQTPAIEYLNDNPHSLLEAGMGTGKTFITIRNMQATATSDTKRTLTLCPVAVMGVWRRELEKHASGEFDSLILDGKATSKMKAKSLHETLKVQKVNGRPLVVVINYESFWRSDIFEVLSEYMWEKVTADEIHRIKSHSVKAKASRHAWQIGKRSGSRLGLTGTPMPNDPGDLFAQYRFLQEDIFGKYWTHFRNQFAVMNQFIPNKVDKWINTEEFQRRYHSIRYYIPKSVLVLPERQDIIVEVDLSPAGRKIYNEMKKESIAEIRKNSDENHVDIKTAVGSNGAVQFLRLLQLAQGFVKDEDKDIIQTDTEKRKVLLDLLEDAGEPVCVYGWFKNDLAIIRQCCELLNLRYGEISGSQKDLTPHAQMPEWVDVMGVQCKSGSAGIDLTRARLQIVMNTGTLTPGDYDQMMARQHRPGQTRNVICYHLVTKKTVETKLIDERGNKRNLIDALSAELFDESPF